MDATADLNGAADPITPSGRTAPTRPAGVEDGCSLTALVPCYNESAQVDVAYQAIDEALSHLSDLEILFVDDGSTDDTLDRMKQLASGDPRVRYLSFSRNFGLEAAFSAGFRYASRPWVVQLDADLQSPPAEAPKLIAKALEGYDVVYGIRVARRDPLWRRIGSATQQWLARTVFGVDLVVGASVFRVVRTSVARRAVALRLATPYFIATLPLLGARSTTVEVAHARRTAGRSRWRLRRLLGHTGELYVGFSLRPLVWLYTVVALGTPLLLVAAGFAAVRPGSGGSALLAGQAVLLGVLGVLAAYVHRLVRGTARPALFYVREANIPIEPTDSLYGEPAPTVRMPEVAR